jgi:hydrogenase maturation protein HypF
MRTRSSGWRYVEPYRGRIPPFVYRLGRSLGLDGRVRNDSGVVVIEAAGPPDALAVLVDRIRAEAPPRARISTVAVVDLAQPSWPIGSGFQVAPSTGRQIPPDLATCDACLAELFDPANRRYRYPFLNCTDCGPRATIVDSPPYDRERTTMRAFPMCPDCGREYADPADRRFHAEPVACPVCGPRLMWTGGGVRVTGERALREAERMIRDGGVVALKGLGGYQLICDARDEDAVARLRARKARPTKPFAVMVADLATARRLAEIEDVEAGQLTSIARPIVLVRPVDGAGLAAGAGPHAPRLGLFLPAAPVHHLLLADLSAPLIVTSGNRSEEPIAIDDDAAAAQLGDIADGLLSHDRVIRSRYDDSVTRVMSGRPFVIRRARGLSPEPMRLPVPATEPLLWPAVPH